jgi:predicted MFS family arabinose efflux permease
MTLYLTPVIGFAWTMRAIGLVCTALCAIACVTLQTRDISGTNSPRAEDEGLVKCLSKAVNIKPFTYDYPYLATTIAVFLIELALFIPLTYISSGAIATGQGMDPEHAYRLIGFLNAGSVPGRVLPGYLADRFGRFNVMIVTALVCTALIACVWLPPIAMDQASEPTFIAFAVLFGFWSGAAISLTPVCIAQVGKVEEIGSRVGTVFSISSIGALIGVPIGGAVIDQSDGGYTGLVIFSGALYVLALGGFIGARFIAGPKRIIAVY